MPALSASASIGRGPSRRTISPHARSTEARLARSRSTMASRSAAPGKAFSSSTRSDGRANRMTVQFGRSLSSVRKARRPMPLVPPVITRHFSPGPDRLPPEIGLIASPSVMFEAPWEAPSISRSKATLRCERADLAVVSWPANCSQAGWRVERKASSSVRVGRPAREPSRVHLSAATAAAMRAQSAVDRPSATISAKAP